MPVWCIRHLQHGLFLFQFCSCLGRVVICYIGRVNVQMATRSSESIMLNE